MFVKIKLEPQNPSSPQKKTTYFPVDEDATLIDLKKNIELYVNVPAERQVLKTLSGSLDDRVSRKIKDICDVKGSPILLLYSYDEFYQELEFVCFLQIYNDDEALHQQEMEERSAKTGRTGEKFPTRNSATTTSSVTLVVESQSESDSSNDCYESQSESDSESDGSNNSESSGGSSKKRRRNSTYITSHITKKLKSSPVMDKLSPTLCKYLDEFPNFEDRKMLSPTELRKNGSHQEGTVAPSGRTTADDDVAHGNNQNHSSAEGQGTQAGTGCNQNSKETTTSKTFDDGTNLNNDQIAASRKIPLRNVLSAQPISSTTSDISHPCKAVNPEFRQYLIIISKKDDSISNSQCHMLLDWFFDRFRFSENVNKLQFNNDAITLFEGKLYIACMNLQTIDWMKSNLKQYPESYTTESLNEGNICEVVIPMVSNNKNLSDVFDLLERQNANVRTSKWCVAKRRTLLPEENVNNAKIVSTICTNELFSISMDSTSKDLLTKYDFKLKYCFWQIVFNFENM